MTLALAHRQWQWAPPAAGAALEALAAAGPGATVVTAPAVVGDCSQAVTGSATDARASGCDGPIDTETDHVEWEAC